MGKLKSESRIGSTMSVIGQRGQNPCNSRTCQWLQFHFEVSSQAQTKGLAVLTCACCHNVRQPHLHGEQGLLTYVQSLFGQEKPININIFGLDGVRETGPVPRTVPRTNQDPSLGQTGRFLLNSTVKSSFCPVCSWDVWGSSLGRLSRKGRQKNV